MVLLLETQSIYGTIKSFIASVSHRMLTTRKRKSLKHRTPPLANKQLTTHRPPAKHLQSGLKPSLLGVLFTNKLPLKEKKNVIVIQIKCLWITNRIEQSLKYIFETCFFLFPPQACGASGQPSNSLWLLISEILDKREGEGRGHWGSASCS